MYEPAHGIDLVGLLKAEFEMCKLKRGDLAAILSGRTAPAMPGPWKYRDQFVDAAFKAFAEMGIKAFHVEMPPVPKPLLPLGPGALGVKGAAGLGSTALAGLAPALGALKNVDFVLDFAMTLFSPELAEMVAGGPKVLICCEPPEACLRLFPDHDLKRRLQNAEKRIAKGTKKSISVTSEAGTDLSMVAGQYGTFIECGFADDPGRWDAFPSGQVGWFPDDHSGDGVFVIDRGDQIVLPYMRYVESPVTLTVKEGYIRGISGGADARLIEDHLASWNDPEVYALGHQSLGLHPNARWDAQSVYGWDSLGMDSRIFYGNYIMGTGPNTLGGGTRNTGCHFDICTRNLTVVIDGETLIDKGKVVAADMRIEGR